MPAGSVLSVTKLNEYVSSILSNEPRLRSVNVSGEISGFKRHSSGHLYFNLKDAGAVVACVMFKSDAARLKTEPEDGMQVVVKGSVSLYVRDGRYQLYASSITRAGEGELYAAFLQLKERLRSEGLFENERPLPAMPRCIGIATSETGAALQDMLNIIHRRFPRMNVLFAPCKVQGEDAPKEIAAAVSALQRFEFCDVIVVGRGGGSYEDLYCFNSELVARAVFSSRVPVVSAVGHETDFTIADFAADLRAPTPSAAAELCCPLYDETVHVLEQAKLELRHDIFDRIENEKRNIAGLMGSAAMSNPHHAVDVMRRSLLIKLAEAEHSTEKRISGYKHKLAELTAALAGSSPKRLAERGYALITDSSGEPIKSIHDLRAGDGISVRTLGGSAKATVNEVLINDKERQRRAE